MKRILFMLFAVIMSTAVCHAAMSNSKVRKETRFLTDKMAYELNLNTAQYNDVYEINYDFISGVRYLMDDVLRGEEWALNRYYDYLDIRNDDLRWVLSRRQYSRFMQAAYFFRPIYVSGGIGLAGFMLLIPIRIISTIRVLIIIVLTVADITVFIIIM